MIDFVHPYGQQHECVGDERLGFVVASGFSQSQIDGVVTLHSQPQHEREICIFLLDNYIVDYCICATYRGVYYSAFVCSAQQWCCNE